MGATGAGKSTFIKTVTSDEAVGVGDGLQSGETGEAIFRCATTRLSIVSDAGSAVIQMPAWRQAIFSRGYPWIQRHRPLRSGSSPRAGILNHRILPRRTKHQRFYMLSQNLCSSKRKAFSISCASQITERDASSYCRALEPIVMRTQQELVKLQVLCV